MLQGVGNGLAYSYERIVRKLFSEGAVDDSTYVHIPAYAVQSFSYHDRYRSHYRPAVHKTLVACWCTGTAGCILIA